MQIREACCVDMTHVSDAEKLQSSLLRQDLVQLLLGGPLGFQCESRWNILPQIRLMKRRADWFPNTKNILLLLRCTVQARR